MKLKHLVESPKFTKDDYILLKGMQKGKNSHINAFDYDDNGLLQRVWDYYPEDMNSDTDTYEYIYDNLDQIIKDVYDEVFNK